SFRFGARKLDHLGPLLGFRKAAWMACSLLACRTFLRSLDMSYFPVDGLVSGIRSQRIAALSRPTDAILRNAAVRPKLTAIKPKISRCRCAGTMYDDPYSFRDEPLTAVRPR